MCDVSELPSFTVVNHSRKSDWEIAHSRVTNVQNLQSESETSRIKRFMILMETPRGESAANPFTPYRSDTRYLWFVLQLHKFRYGKDLLSRITEERNQMEELITRVYDLSSYLSHRKNTALV